MPVPDQCCKFSMKLIYVAFAANWCTIVLALTGSQTTSHSGPLLWTYDVVAEYPHDPTAFTQGLQFDRVCDDASELCYDVFWESTGLNGKSEVRQVDVNTGQVRMRTKLASQYFAEGLARVNDTLYQLTWRTPTGFAYSSKDLSQVASFSTDLADGWGLTYDGSHLIATDSSALLYFLDPLSMKTVKSVTVRDRGTPIRWLNELEMVNGEVWANIWQRECIARINPVSGEVLGWVMLLGLRRAMQARMTHHHQVDVLNGIAYDASSRRLFVTGKLWPSLYEVVLKPADNKTLADVEKICWPPSTARQAMRAGR